MAFFGRAGGHSIEAWPCFGHSIKKGVDLRQHPFFGHAFCAIGCIFLQIKNAVASATAFDHFLIVVFVIIVV